MSTDQISGRPLPLWIVALGIADMNRPRGTIGDCDAWNASDMPNARRYCDLYVHKDDAQRCMALAIGAPFPPRWRPQSWRLIASGVEAGADAESALAQRRFYVFRVRTKALK